MVKNEKNERLWEIEPADPQVTIEALLVMETYTSSTTEKIVSVKF